MKLAIGDAGSEICPRTLLISIFVESAEMSGDTGMQSTDDVEQNLFLSTHFFEMVFRFETIFLIDEFPDIGPVIVGERFNVRIDIEVFSVIVCFVLDMPNPTIFTIISLISPEILTWKVSLNLLRVGPKFWNVLIIAPTNCTTFALTYLSHHT